VDVKELELNVDWFHLAQHIAQWRLLVNSAMNLFILWNSANSLVIIF